MECVCGVDCFVFLLSSVLLISTNEHRTMRVGQEVTRRVTKATKHDAAPFGVVVVVAATAAATPSAASPAAATVPASSAAFTVAAYYGAAISASTGEYVVCFVGAC